MRNKHHITFSYDDDIQAIKRTLQDAKIPFDEEFVILDIYDDHPQWKIVQSLIERYQPAVHFCESSFTQSELHKALWLQFACYWHNGYPMPDGDFGYLDLAYDLSQYCEECGRGYVQTAPFRLKGEPKWGTRNMMSLNWVFDAFFVRPEVWATVFQPFGIGCRPVLKYRTEQRLDTVVQLQIDALLPGKLMLDGYPVEVCPRCHTIKYNAISCGEFPRMTAIPTDVHAAYSQEYFGSGGRAFRVLLISQEFYQHLERYKVKPISLVPVQDSPDAVCAPSTPWVP